MSLFLFCVLDNNNILKTVQNDRNSQKHELYVHLKASSGLAIDAILQFPDHAPDGYVQFNQQVYWYCIVDGVVDEGRFLFLTDTPVLLHYFRTALDQTVEGIQVFDDKGDLLYLNKTCEQMENLSLQNVEGKHVLEIYEVDREYSTIMNTLKKREKIENRCGIFQNKEGQHLYSINTGVPVMLERYFLGAIGLVYDAGTFSEIDYKRDTIQKYLKDHNTPIKINNHDTEEYDTFDDIIGESEAIRGAAQLAKKVAGNDVSVLLHGETGVGKEIFAQSIHSASPRRSGEFVAVNCAALPSSIVESLLFGTTKGTFTGSTEKKGLFEVADGGTIFLDEINSMDISLQSKLLRVIQEKSFRRLGSTKLIRCNLRFITAMNETPEQAIANNHLREDLFYRLGTIVIEIPPLRQRGQDILLLAYNHLTQLSKKYFRNILEISPEVENILLNYRWQGNVRELFQTLEYACNMTDGNRIERDHLPGRLLGTTPFANRAGERAAGVTEMMESSVSSASDSLTLQEKLDACERQILERALILHDCNITKAAEYLGIKRQNLQYRIKKCGIKIAPQMMN